MTREGSAGLYLENVAEGGVWVGARGHIVSTLSSELQSLEFFLQLQNS